MHWRDVSTAHGPRPVSDPGRKALYGSAATRQIEQWAASTLPHRTLMSRAGLSVARLAQALRPHARCLWVACGPGNNGGDGLVAATHLHRWMQARGGTSHVVVTHFSSDDTRLPADALDALQSARAAGVVFADEPPTHFDLAIDALLGIGTVRPPQGRLAHWLKVLRDSSNPVLCVDLPSGLDAETGTLAGDAGAETAGERHTLSLITLKPGLFTGAGRDASGQVWLDDLGTAPPESTPVNAWLGMQPTPMAARLHASHKGSFGDVLVLGGQGISMNGAGMTGAAVLAARAALHGGAGRVFVGLLEDDAPNRTAWDPVCPELMFRNPSLLLDSGTLKNASVVCGCGGGAAVAALLPRVLSTARTLVLDADALNAIAADVSLQTLVSLRRDRGRSTVLTPHPLEAARLLESNTRQVMADRIKAAQTLADRFGACCVLKGSGSVVAAPGEVPIINASGNAALATAGTGDVLAGMIGCALAPPGLGDEQTWNRVASAVHQHGWLADHWHDTGHAGELSASRLAARVRPLSW